MAYEMVMTMMLKRQRYPGCGLVELFSVASEMHLLYSNDYQYILSIEKGIPAKVL